MLAPALFFQPIAGSITQAVVAPRTSSRQAVAFVHVCLSLLVACALSACDAASSPLDRPAGKPASGVRAGTEFGVRAGALAQLDPTAGSQTSTSRQAQAGSGVDPSLAGLPGFAFGMFKAPAIPNGICAGKSNVGAQIARVQFAQTVLMETTSPFFHLSAGRDTAIRVVVTGSGGAPDVVVTARANGGILGSVCLRGPVTLPTSEPVLVSLNDSFVGNIPAAWVVPDLQLTVAAGGASQSVASGALKVGPRPVLSFVTLDWLLWGDKSPTPLPPNFAAEFASRLPLSAVQHSAFPLTLSLAKLPIEPREDGLAANGVEARTPAVVATSAPACSDSQAKANRCKPWNGFGILSAVIELTHALQLANGLAEASHWYGALGRNSGVGGGLGGGVTGSGDDYGLTFNHELGHAFDMPHWGDDLYSRTKGDQRHPYTGQFKNDNRQPNGGGFGDAWAFDPLIPSLFSSPICPKERKERQDPMQRSGPDCAPSGTMFDYFSDYSSLFIHRYFVGATDVYKGIARSPRDQLGNKSPPFSMPTKPGRYNMVMDATGGLPQFERWDSAKSKYAREAAKPDSPTTFQLTFPQSWNQPVYTLWGSFSNATPDATTILQPLKYKGALPRTVDPTNAADFSEFKAVSDFEEGADLMAQAEFSDGSFSRALLRVAPRSTDPLSGKSFTYWAVNVPAKPGLPLRKVSLYQRQMESRDSRENTAFNVNGSKNRNLTSANYLSGAKLVKELVLGVPL